MNSKKAVIRSLWAGILLMLGTFPVWAVSYDIKEMTPAAEQALSGRQARFGQVQELKAQGVLGEGNRGYVEVIKDEGQARQIADAENRDRQTLYRTIAEQNQLGADGLSVIESVFAEVQREKARPGDSIQLPSGAWSKK